MALRILKLSLRRSRGYLESGTTAANGLPVEGAEQGRS